MISAAHSIPLQVVSFTSGAVVPAGGGGEKGGGIIIRGRERGVIRDVEKERTRDRKIDMQTDR